MSGSKFKVLRVSRSLDYDSMSCSHGGFRLLDGKSSTVDVRAGLYRLNAVSKRFSVDD